MVEGIGYTPLLNEPRHDLTEISGRRHTYLIFSRNETITHDFDFLHTHTPDSTRVQRVFSVAAKTTLDTPITS